MTAKFNRTLRNYSIKVWIRSQYKFGLAVTTVMLAVFPPDDGKSGSGLFHVKSSNGVISTIDTFERDGVDGESYYNIVVLATDGGTPARSVKRSVTVKIMDVNDEMFNHPYIRA